MDEALFQRVAVLLGAKGETSLSIVRAMLQKGHPESYFARPRSEQETPEQAAVAIVEGLTRCNCLRRTIEILES